MWLINLLVHRRTCRKINSLNILLFGGSPVLSELDGSILFNTDFIYVPTADAAYVDRTNTAEFVSKLSLDNTSSRYPVSSVQPVRANAQPPGALGDQSNYVAVTSPLATPTPSNGSSKRMMAITVPPTAGPGSVLTVSAPDGTLISVSPSCFEKALPILFFFYECPMPLHVMSISPLTGSSCVHLVRVYFYPSLCVLSSW